MPFSLESWDQRAVLGFDVWNFSWRSLARPYGRWFLTSIVLRHPWRMWRGLVRYRRWTRPRRRPDLAWVSVESLEALRDRLRQGAFVVGTGFCQKPLDPPCPAENFYVPEA